MSAQKQHNQACGSEEIVAYLDGDLDGEASARLEEHLAECARCDRELKAQQRLLRELEFALAEDVSVEMPENFARVVAARAQSDLSGVRAPHERRRAFYLSASLAVIAFILLGGATFGESIFSPVRSVWKCFAAILSFLGHALYDLGAGFAVISRGVGGHMIFESRSLSLFVFLLFASALFMLRRLIIGYHRAPVE